MYKHSMLWRYLALHSLIGAVLLTSTLAYAVPDSQDEKKKKGQEQIERSQDIGISIGITTTPERDNNDGKDRSPPPHDQLNIKGAPGEVAKIILDSDARQNNDRRPRDGEQHHYSVTIGADLPSTYSDDQKDNRERRELQENRPIILGVEKPSEGAEQQNIKLKAEIQLPQLVSVPEVDHKINIPKASSVVVVQNKLPEWHDPNSPVFKYMNSHVVSTLLYDNARKTNQRMGFYCNDRFNIDIGDVEVYSPIEFTSSSVHPTSGYWHRRYRLHRCGRVIVYNLFFIAQTKDAPLYFEGPPGETLAPLQTIVDMTPWIYRAVAGYLAGFCTPDQFAASAFTNNTKVMVQPSDNGHQTVWQERWDIVACNVTVGVMVQLIRDNATGDVKYNIMTVERL